MTRAGIAAPACSPRSRAGVDAVDGAIDALSGLTSQPNLGSLVEAFAIRSARYGLDRGEIAVMSTYWEQVTPRAYVAIRKRYPLRRLRSVCSSACPGGQYTNLREQARVLGLDESSLARSGARLWRKSMKCSATSSRSRRPPRSSATWPSPWSRAVSRARPCSTRQSKIAFPDSVVRLFHGDLGQPIGGFPRRSSEKKCWPAKLPLGRYVPAN